MTFGDIVGIIFFSAVGLFLVSMSLLMIKDAFDKKDCAECRSRMRSENQRYRIDFDDATATKEQKEPLEKQIAKPNDIINEQEDTISDLKIKIDLLNTRNDNQAQTIREQRAEIDRLTSLNKNQDKTTKEQKEILTTSTQLNPGELIRLQKIKFEKWHKEVEAIKAVRVNFSKEFQNAVAKNIDWDDFYQVLEEDALCRAFDTDNSILTLGEVELSVKVKSEHVDGTNGGPYEVTLNSCGCVDYLKRGRKKPCKHMAYLAYALGILQQDVVANEKVVEQHKKMRQELNEYRRQKRQQKAKTEYFFNANPIR